MTARAESSNGNPASTTMPSTNSKPAEPNFRSAKPERGFLWFSVALASLLACSGAIGGLVAFGRVTGPIAAILCGEFVICAAVLAQAIELARISRRLRDKERRPQEQDLRVIELLEEITRRLDGLAAAPALTGIDPGLLAIERGFEAADWELAGSLIEALAIARPDDPALGPLRLRLEQGRQSAARALSEELQAARAAGDVERVLELHGLLGHSLDHEAKGALDRELAGWFLDRIQRRLHGGKIQREVVDLATRVAESFAATTAGASLRQSLPMLRRSVGLCPKCAQPYLGVAQACPVCLAAAANAQLPANPPGAEV